MLVLTRKTGQKLIISDTIEVTILETKGDAVKIGIQAPRDVSVYREEIYEEIKKSNMQAQAAPKSLDLNALVGRVNPPASGIALPPAAPKPASDNSAEG